MLAGFLLLKLPVATMVNGSVSLAEQNGFPQGAVGKKREKFAKARKKCKGSSESRHRQRELARALPFQREGSALVAQVDKAQGAETPTTANQLKVARKLAQLGSDPAHSRLRRPLTCRDFTGR